MEALEKHQEQQAAELRAASAAPTLAPAPAPDPLIDPLPAASLQSAPFDADSFAQHPFFHECAVAAAADDPDVLLEAQEGAVQADSDDEGVLAELAVAFGGLADRAAELDAYLRSEVRGAQLEYDHHLRSLHMFLCFCVSSRCLLSVALVFDKLIVGCCSGIASLHRISLHFS